MCNHLGVFGILNDVEKVYEFQQNFDVLCGGSVVRRVTRKKGIIELNAALLYLHNSLMLVLSMNMSCMCVCV